MNQMLSKYQSILAKIHCKVKDLSGKVDEQDKEKRKKIKQIK